MGKSTKLYAVNLEEIRAGVGSNDDSLLNRMCEFVASFFDSEDEKEESELVPDHSVKLTNDGQILFRERERSLPELCSDILSLNSGVLEFVIEPPWTARHDEVIRTTNDAITRSGVQQVLTRFESDDPSVDTSPNVTWTRDDSAEDENPTLQFGVSPSSLAELVRGELQTNNPELGQSLEILCYVLGMKLPDEDLLGDLAALKLDTELATPRCPIELTGYEDSIKIGYLTADSVLKDALRFSKMNLAFPEDEVIEEARNALVRCFKQAAIEGLAIVSFER